MGSKSSINSRVLLASAAAGLMTLAVAASPGDARAEEGGGEPAKVKCYGINSCKGTGECGGKGHACAGKNACKGQGWVYKDKDECLSTEGGRLTPSAE